MSASKAAYEDCYEIFERALKAERGIRIYFSEEGQARMLIARLHQARTLWREESLQTYAQGEPGYNTSPFDALVVRQPKTNISGTSFSVDIEKRIAPTIEELPLNALPTQVER